MHAYRTHTCGALRSGDVGSPARLSGWVHRVRDHGGLLFIDLRDHYGLTQIVADPQSPVFALAETLKPEWVMRIDGEVVARAADTVNPNMATGEIEIWRGRWTCWPRRGAAASGGQRSGPGGYAAEIPFPRPAARAAAANICGRDHLVVSATACAEAGFFEFQTPILTASSPEGARDYLVPSRVHPGKFYALPQAPQQFKQLLMVAGFDRYFQIAPCFRDEDARADRSPGEFYQLDMEMCFVTQDDVFAVVETILRGLFEEFSRQARDRPPFPRIPYAEAMLKYGTDKPDLRIPIEMQDVTRAFPRLGLQAFAG